MSATAKKYYSAPNARPRASARLEARISNDQKEFFQRAADLKGVSFTDFVVDSVANAAKRTVEEHEVLKLEIKDRQAFVDALMNPPAPNTALRLAAKRYKKAMER